MLVYRGLQRLLLAATITIASAACGSGADCSLNGVCSPSGSCACDPGWDGPSCAKLKLAPAPPGGVYGFGTPFATTSWGGNAIWDNETALWHLFVTDIGGANCGLHGWSGGSTVAHATSEAILGPYTKQDIALTHEAHNPQAIRLADGKWYIWHIGTANGKDSPRACNESGSGQPPAEAAEGHSRGQPPPHPHPPSPPASKAAGSTVHTSSSPGGPWAPVHMLPASAGHCNNPSPFLHPNGTLYLACTWTLRRSLSGSAAGPWSDPWPIVTTTEPFGGGGDGGGDGVAVAVSTARPLGTWEDPFLFVDRRGHFHILAHIWSHKAYPLNPISGHAFSLDGHNWTFSSTQPYSNAVQRTDGSLQHFATLERPKLLWGDALDPFRPTALTNGASPVWGPNVSNPCHACNNGAGGPGFCSECKVAAKARGNAYDLDWTYTLGRPVTR